MLMPYSVFLDFFKNDSSKFVHLVYNIGFYSPGCALCFRHCINVDVQNVQYMNINKARFESFLTLFGAHAKLLHYLELG